VLVAHGRRVAVHVAEEGLLSVVGHLHRAPGAQGQQAGVHVHRQVLAAAEGAAHAGQRQPHLLGRQGEGGADLLLVHVQPLGGDVQLHAAVLGRHGEAGLRAEERLVLHPHLVLAHHDDVRGRRRVTGADLEVPHQVPLRVQVGALPAQLGDLGGGVVHLVPGRVPQRGARVGDRLQHVVVDVDAGGGQPGGLRVVGGDQRHRFALVADDVEGQHRLVGQLEPVDLLARHVVGGEHGGDAGGGQRRAGVDRADPGVGVRAAQGDPPEHVLHPEVAAVGELATDLQDAVGPLGVVADPAAAGPGQVLRCPGRRAGRRAHRSPPAVGSAIRSAASRTASRIFS
jgi:hypothetical protein